MLGNYFRRSTDNEKRADRKQIQNKIENKTEKLKSTVLPQVEAKGSIKNSLAFLDLRLRQHCQFLTLVFCQK